MSNGRPNHAVRLPEWRALRRPGECLADHGVPSCAPGELCREGCLYSDFDADGDLDLCDYRAFQIGFSGRREKPEWAVPDQEYWLVFDVDDDTDIDLGDFQRLHRQLTGP